MSLSVARQQSPCVRKIAMVANTRKHIEQLALLRLRVRSTICSQQRQRQPPRNFDCSLISRFFLAAIMALEFDVNAIASKNLAKLRHRLRRALNTAVRQRMRQWPL